MEYEKVIFEILDMKIIFFFQILTKLQPQLIITETQEILKNLAQNVKYYFNLFF